MGLPTAELASEEHNIPTGVPHVGTLPFSPASGPKPRRIRLLYKSRDISCLNVIETFRREIFCCGRLLSLTKILD